MSLPEIEETPVDPVEQIVVEEASRTREAGPNLFDKKMAELSGALPADAFKAYTLSYQANKIGHDIVEQFRSTYRGDAGNAYAMRQVAKAFIAAEIAEQTERLTALQERLAAVEAADVQE